MVQMSDEVDLERVRGWAARWIGSPLRIRELTGGWTSTMLQLSTSESTAVVRLMTREPWRSHGEALTTRESQVQQMLADSGVPAPRSIALDAAGGECGVPAHLMSLVPGRVEADRSDWSSLDVLAEALATIHAVEPTIPVRTYQSWAWEAKFVVPSWSHDSGLWTEAFDLLRQHKPPRTDWIFLHRDFQPRNVLWVGDRISGIVDWVETSTGPRWLDVAHCSTHLAMHHGSSVGRAFAQSYAERTGAQPVPYFDVMDIVGNLPAPGRPALITDPGQLRRLEDHLRATLETLNA